MNMMTAIVPPAEGLTVPTWKQWREKVDLFRSRLAEDEAAIDRADAVPSDDPGHARLSAEQDATCEAALAAERDLYATPAPNAAALREKMEIFRDYGIGGDFEREHMQAIIDDYGRLDSEPLVLGDAPAAAEGRGRHQVCPSAIAFMRAFEHRQSSAFLDGAPPCSAAEFQFNEYAYEGARDMIARAEIEDVHSGAIVSITAWELIDMVIDNYYQPDDFVRDHDEKDALLKVRAALLNLWRFMDKKGGTIARPFAEWVVGVD